MQIKSNDINRLVNPTANIHVELYVLELTKDNLSVTHCKVTWCCSLLSNRQEIHSKY